MIHIQGNSYVPGTTFPKRYEEDVPPVDEPALKLYLEEQAWESGLGLTIVGPPGSGKTNVGMAALYGIFKVTKSQGTYIIEADYMNDLRRLWRMEEMASRAMKDDAAWDDYMLWERQLQAIKDAPVLFLDDLGRGYTPMQRYEIETLLRDRVAAGRVTVVGVDAQYWENFSEALKNTLTKQGMLLTLAAVDTDED